MTVIPESCPKDWTDCDLLEQYQAFAEFDQYSLPEDHNPSLELNGYLLEWEERRKKALQSGFLRYSDSVLAFKLLAGATLSHEINKEMLEELQNKLQESNIATKATSDEYNEISIKKEDKNDTYDCRHLPSSSNARDKPPVSPLQLLVDLLSAFAKSPQAAKATSARKKRSAKDQNQRLKEESNHELHDIDLHEDEPLPDQDEKLESLKRNLLQQCLVEDVKIEVNDDNWESSFGTEADNHQSSNDIRRIVSDDYNIKTECDDNLSQDIKSLQFDDPSYEEGLELQPAKKKFRAKKKKKKTTQPLAPGEKRKRKSKAVVSTCPECGKVFPCLSKMSRHRKQHLKPNTCGICGKVYADGSNFRRHLKLHSVRQKFSCQQCDKVFKSLGGLQNHERMHRGEVRRFICNICGKNYAQANCLKVHMRVHTGETPFKCGDCGQQFMREDVMKTHQVADHPDKYSHSYMCQECGKGFHKANRLNVHMRQHTGERPHPCPHCERAFASRKSLLGHIRSHTGERPFKCPSCERAFADCSNLKAHMKIHTGERHSCGDCEKQFSRLELLRKHIKIHHPYISLETENQS